MTIPKLPRWLVAVIVVTPALVTGVVVIANRGERTPSPSPSSSTSDETTDYTIGAPLLPVRTAVLGQAISAPSQLPTPADCDALLTWAAGQGPAAVNAGRVDLALTANRLLQVTVGGVSVKVAERRPATARTFVQCDTSDWRNRWDPLPGSDGFAENVTVHGEDYFTQAPVVTLERSADHPVFTVDYDTPPDSLHDRVMTVAPGEHVRLPFYLVRDGSTVSDADQVVLVVAVRLTVNGRAANHEFTVTMHHFHEQPPGTARYEWLTDERRWVKDRKFNPDRAAPSPTGGGYLCETFTKSDLAEPLGADFKAFTPVDNSCAWTGQRDVRIELYSDRHPDVKAATEQHRRLVKNFAGVDGVTSTQLQGIGDEAVLISSGFLLARRGRDTLTLSIDKYPGATGPVLERLARVAAAHLWK